MVVLVLHDAGMEVGHLTFDHIAVAVHPAIADARRARHRGAQVRDRQAALPVQHAFLAQQFDFRIDQHRAGHRDVVRIGAGALAGDAEHEQPQRHMDLRRGEADAGRVLHGFDHVADQPADFRRAGVGHRVAAAEQHRVTHAGDLENEPWDLRDGVAETALARAQGRVIARVPVPGDPAAAFRRAPDGRERQDS